MARPSLARSGRLARDAAGALAWLRTAAESIVTADAKGMLRACVLAALCGDLGAQDSDRLVRRFTRALGGVTLRALIGCGGALVCLAAVALVRRGSSLPRALAEYVQIAQSEGADGRAGPLVSFLLGRLAVGAGTRSWTPRARRACKDLRAAALLGAGKGTVRNALARIEAASVLRTSPVESEGGLPEILDAIAVERLSRYDLEFAASVIRARYYVSRVENLASTTFRTFVATQRAEDGSFGVFHREAAFMRRSRRAASPSLLVVLPTTLAVLWALAEMDAPGYRLFRDLGAR